MKNDEPIIFKLTPLCYPYNYGSGNFAFITKRNEFDPNLIESVSWHTCRETFAYAFLNKESEGKKVKFDQFICTHFSGKADKLISFIKEVEEKLKLQNRTRFYSCENQDEISICEPNAWWFENLMRVHLFTILLRCGVNYEDNFEKALYSVNYAISTRAAIEKFFQGFTKWAGTENNTGNSEHKPKEMTWKWGWVKFFDGGANLDLMII